MLCKRKCGNSDALKNSLRKLKRTISEAATRFSGYHQHVRDILRAGNKNLFFLLDARMLSCPCTGPYLIGHLKKN